MELDAAKESYLKGKYTALNVILDRIDTLVRFYPEHIYREDRIFFPASLGYLTEQQEETMLGEMWEWDRRMIHDKYAAVIDTLEGTLEAVPERPRELRS